MSFSKLSKALHKVEFYLKGSLAANLPDFIFRPFLSRKLADLSDCDQELIRTRVNYYNKLEGPFELTDSAVRIGDFRQDKSRAYFLDMKELVRYFSSDLKIQYLFRIW